MKRWIPQMRALLFGDRQADRVVPPSGFTAQLTVFAAGAMAFLAVFVLALALSAGRQAQSWGQELAGTATIRIMAPMGEAEAQTDAALRVLETTAGVRAARALAAEEQRALLAPWFGADLPMDNLPIPRLVALDVDPGMFDAAGLRLRLAAEVPGATLDDHGRWRAPLASAAERLRWLAWGAAILIAAAVAAVVTLAAQAALSANAQVIAVLRLIGATDTYIAGAFVRRFTLRVATGALAGTVLGLLVMFLIPSGADTGLLTGLRFSGTGWFVPLLVPILSAGVAMGATALATQRTLKELS